MAFLSWQIPHYVLKQHQTSGLWPPMAARDQNARTKGEGGPRPRPVAAVCREP
jgi:hypothetical protein